MTRDSSCWRRAVGSTLFLVLLTIAVPPARGAGEVHVRYRSADTVYLSSGAAAGLAEGDRLEILREDEVIAVVEVIFTAQYSASCRIVSEAAPIRPNDFARPLASGLDASGKAAEIQDVENPDSVPRAPVPAVVQEVAPAPALGGEAKRRSASIRGSLTLDREAFRDDSEAGLDFDRTTGRLKLRIRDIGGKPLEFRLRLRGQQNERVRALTTGASESESRDRLYEAVAVWDPADGRYSFRLGRISANPFLSVGFLDGALGGVRLTPRVTLGGFFGSRAIIGESAFESTGQKYGLFSRFTSAQRTGRPGFELVTAAVREDGDLDVSREYVAVQTRYTPLGRWSFYQWAEIDLNRGWRKELADSSSQLSFLSVSVVGRFSARARLSLAYDRSERYRTEETRSISAELFDDLMRQGLRGTLSIGKPRGLNFSLTAGIRQRDDEQDDTMTFGAGLRHGDLPWGLSASANALSFTNRLNEGYVVTVRTARRFSGGHEIDLATGLRDSTSRQFDGAESLTTHWFRLGAWYELPGDLFLRASYEMGRGDELDSTRLEAGLGFRF